MLVEHVFVTTYEEQEAMRRAALLLEQFGFRVVSGAGSDIQATRGKKTSNTRKVVALPQTVQITYDRGLVTVAAGITARGGKDLPIHAELMTALAQALERLLVDRDEPDRCAVGFREVEIRAGTIWPTSEKIAIGCGLALLVVAVIGLIIALIVAIAG